MRKFQGIARIEKVEKNDIYNYLILRFPRETFDFLNNFDPSLAYNVTVSKNGTKKTQQQNKFSWLLMTDIARQLDVFPDKDSVYMQLIKMSKFENHYYQVVVYDQMGIVNSLKDKYRIVHIEGRGQGKSGKPILYLGLYNGMSAFSKEETSSFIDNLFEFCAMNDVPYEHYERYIRGYE